MGEPPGHERHRDAHRRREVDADRRQRGGGVECVHREREQAGIDLDGGDVGGGHAGAQRRVYRRLHIRAAGTWLERERLGQPDVAERPEHRRARHVREVAQQPPRVLDDLERPVEALGSQQSGARALQRRLRCGQELRRRPHEAGPQAERRLVEGDGECVGKTLRVEPGRDAGADRAARAVDRRPELAVVRAEEQRRPEAAGDLVRRHLGDERALGIGGESARGPNGGMAGVAHVEVVVPVVGNRRRRARVDLAQRARRGDSGDGARRLLAGAPRGEHRGPLQLCALDHGRRQAVAAQSGRPRGDALYLGHEVSANSFQRAPAPRVQAAWRKAKRRERRADIHRMGRFFRRFMLILCAIAFAAFGGWATTDHFMALAAAGASFSSIFLAAA